MPYQQRLSQMPPIPRRRRLPGHLTRPVAGDLWGLILEAGGTVTGRSQGCSAASTGRVSMSSGTRGDRMGDPTWVELEYLPRLLALMPRGSWYEFSAWMLLVFGEAGMGMTLWSNN